MRYLLGWRICGFGRIWSRFGFGLIRVDSRYFLAISYSHYGHFDPTETDSGFGRFRSRVGFGRIRADPGNGISQPRSFEIPMMWRALYTRPYRLRGTIVTCGALAPTPCARAWQILIAPVRVHSVHNVSYQPKNLKTRCVLGWHLRYNRPKLDKNTKNCRNSPGTEP